MQAIKQNKKVCSNKGVIMQALKSKITRALPVGCEVEVCDNSGAKTIKVFSVIGNKTVKGRIQSAGISDLVMASVKKGRPDMRKQVVYAVIVRQRKAFKRADGSYIRFDENAVVVLEGADMKAGRVFGPIPREIKDRGYSKLTSLAPEVI